MQEQIERLQEQLARIRGKDPISRTRRASLTRRILELMEQMGGEE